MPDEHEEVTWPLGAYPAWLTMDEDGYEGFLHFNNPKNGDREAIRVTLGVSYSRSNHWHVWHIEHRGTELIVSPSIHFLGYFHSPNPVTFRLISKKEYEGG